MMGKSSRVMNQGVLHRRGGGGGDGGGSAARGWEGDDGDVMLPPRTCEAEVLGIIGYGGVGKKVEMLAKALGMKVLISGRKGGGDDTAAAATTTTTSPPPHTPGQQPERTPFTTLLRTASVVVLCCPRSPETINLISAPELALMPPHALLINVSRGGVVDEPALLEALQAKRIAGAATDVFLTEPATPDNSVLLLGEDKTRDLNLLTTPHVAWYAEETIKAYNRALQDNLRGWLGKEGRPKYPVVWYGKDSAEQE
ncbi:D-isomer specific 2-hydroxyacid dehydrogenase [Microdochium trichocladiopsis]|uniref:D-isomer specific 2-hydroxyacid dehydrogenase n=1 Tax=Microdochium trichocladiopsis TaxID=1682393 RepID=A0A9P8Y180_9PEZI|nr:D-isomer specific 2-hydroxyacid dehydrogenase [Microdochium trichocladiopsis]KAH7026616.1 D-isomer specific 2-hydroxyacid dehydrogenase [Microdochium trichocladiopsis]